MGDMKDVVLALTVTINCVKKVGRDEPIEPEDDLFSHGIDNELIDRFVNAIATNDDVGLPSLSPPFGIDQNVFNIDEDSTVNDVAMIVFANAFFASSNTILALRAKGEKQGAKKRTKKRVKKEEKDEA